MKLAIYKRKGHSKSDLSQIRHRGDVPAVIYSKGMENINVCVKGTEFESLLRGLEQGHLPNTKIHLEGEGISTKVVIKDIQYEATSYKVIHLDFLQLAEEKEIHVNIPVRFTGIAECGGIKLGGFLRQVIRHVKVRCLPKNIPHEFVLDVQELSINQNRRVSDIVMPKGVIPVVPVKEVVVVIAKR